MSVVLSAPPQEIRVLRAPPLDPPFDDELSPSTYVPVAPETWVDLPAEAIAGASRDSQLAARRFLDHCLEALNGFRSPMQLRPMLHIEHAHDVLEEVGRALRRLSDLRRREKGKRPMGVVRRKLLRICEPRRGVAEVAAVLSDGGRIWSLCYRLELVGTTWRCTILKCLPF